VIRALFTTICEDASKAVSDEHKKVCSFFLELKLSIHQLPGRLIAALQILTAPVCSPLNKKYL
jgi:hypothetical protein